MSHNDELIAVMERARLDLERAIAPFRDRLAFRLDGGWTVGETLAHIAVWERVSARMTTGEPLPYGEEHASQTPWNLDDFNEAMRRLASGWTDDQILTEFAAAHQALIEAVRSAPEIDCAPKGRVWQTINVDGAGHYCAHFSIPDQMAARWPNEVERE